MSNTELRTMNVADIRMDLGWNSRSEARARAGSHPQVVGVDGKDVETTPGLPGLAESLRIDGQRVRVDVCEAPDGPMKGEPWLATGFRRALAVQLNTSLDPKDGGPVGSKGRAPGEIDVIYHTGLSWEEIRVLNIGENVRENIAIPDQVHAFMELRALNPGLKQDDIAARFGIHKSYVSQLFTIGTKVDPQILKDWRESTVKPLSKNDMLEIAKLETAKEQLKTYKEQTAARVPVDPEVSNGDEWVKPAEARAHAFGYQLGTLIRLGIVVIKPEYLQGWQIDPELGELEAGENLLNPEVAADMLKLKSTTTKVVRTEDGKIEKKTGCRVSVTTHRKIAACVSDGIIAGIIGPEADEEEEGEEEETAKDKKQDKALAKAEAAKKSGGKDAKAKNGKGKAPKAPAAEA